MAGPRVARAILIVLTAVLVGAGAYYLMMARRTAPSTVAAPAATPAAGETARSQAEAVERITLPPLDESDALVRQRIGVLSSHPLVTTWLATTGLVRNFVVVVDNVAHGIAPSSHLRVLRPREPFRVMTRPNHLVADPRNYQRFSPIAAAAASIDIPVAARTYATFKPLLQMAFDELGNQQPFDQAVETAIVSLLRVPVIEGDVRLEPSKEGVAFEYEDSRLEALTGAQKQLLRMGPDNVRLIQQQLRAFAIAIGIPEQRLS